MLRRSIRPGLSQKDLLKGRLTWAIIVTLVIQGFIVFFPLCPRLQNCPYFCVFKYARAAEQKVWNEAENRDLDWEERVRLAGFARVRLLRRALPISLLILRKKKRLFAVYLCPVT